MTRNRYRHTETGIETEIDDSFAALFPGAFELVVEKKAEEKPAPANAVEASPAETKKTNSSKEGNK